jgi:hypothetical protein
MARKISTRTTVNGIMVNIEPKRFINVIQNDSKSKYEIRGCCCICGRKNGVSIDWHHMKYHSSGGSDDWSNITPVCPDCHRRIHHGYFESVVVIKSVYVMWLEANNLAKESDFEVITYNHENRNPKCQIRQKVYKGKQQTYQLINNR